MTRILITGGAGFIGRALCAGLVRLGDYEIVVLDNESGAKRTSLNGLPLRFIVGDVRRPSDVEAAMAGCAIVIHLAGCTRVADSVTNPRHNFETNALGTFNVLEAARALSISRLINASTGGAILGPATPPVHEDMVARPLAPYGASKLAAEGYCSAYAHAFGLSIATLRFSNVYGPGSLHKGSVVAAFFRRILASEPITLFGNGNQTRDFLFVEDLVAGVVQCLRSEAVGVYQLGSGQPTSVNELITRMVEVVGPDREIEVRRMPARSWEILCTWCRIDKARAAFGFHPDTDLTTGLRLTWDWFVRQSDHAEREAPNREHIQA